MGYIKTPRTLTSVEAAASSHRTLLFGLAIGAVAAWIDLGRMHNLQNADSLLLVLISLQHWTPFFWGQDRFGMLGPLLAIWARDPLTNLLVQGWITTTAGLLAPFLAARLVLPKTADWIVAGTAATGLLFCTASRALQFDWLITQPCGMALTLGCAGLVIVDGLSPWRRLLGCLALGAAHWVDGGIVLVLFPLATLNPGASDRKWSIGGVLAGAAVGALLSRTVDAPHTPVSVSPVGEWLAAWMALVRNTVHVSSGWGLALVVGLVAGAAIRRTHMGPASRPAPAPGVIALVAVIAWLGTGTLAWVAANGYAPRYVYPSLALLAVAGGCYFETAIAWRPRYRHLSVGVVVASLLAASGLPSVLMVRRTLHERFGAMSSEVVHLGVRVIGGNYWSVWPTVFEANLTAARLHSATVIYGLTSRSDVTDDAWRGDPNILLATVPGDPDLDEVAKRAHVQVRLLENYPAFDLYSVRSR